MRAVRVARFGGRVVIAFDRPRQVRLSPKSWIDGYQSQATCRTILVDLTDGGAAQGDTRSIQYTISNAGPTQEE